MHSVMFGMKRTSGCPTRWIGGTGGGGGSSREIMAGLWTTVQLPPLLPEEEMEILQGAFPELAPLLAPALEVLRLCQDPSRMRSRSLRTGGGTAEGVIGVPLRPSGRHFSLRDLFKWCRRLQVCTAGPPQPLALKWGSSTCCIHDPRLFQHASTVVVVVVVVAVVHTSVLVMGTHAPALAGRCSHTRLHMHAHTHVQAFARPITFCAWTAVCAHAYADRHRDTQHACKQVQAHLQTHFHA